MNWRDLVARYDELMRDPHVRAPLVVLLVVAIGCWCVYALLLLTQ